MCHGYCCHGYGALLYTVTIVVDIVVMVTVVMDMVYFLYCHYCCRYGCHGYCCQGYSAPLLYCVHSGCFAYKFICHFPEIECRGGKREGMVVQWLCNQNFNHTVPCIPFIRLCTQYVVCRMLYSVFCMYQQDSLKLASHSYMSWHCHWSNALITSDNICVGVWTSMCSC